MANIAAPAPRRRNLASWSLVLAGVALLAIVPFSLTKAPFGHRTAAPGASDRVHIAYFEFGLTADTLWLADPASPGQRSHLLSVRHALEYGVVPSLAPDGHRFAYSVLPPETPAPGPDAPAQLWTGSLRDAPPRLIAGDVDLLVPAVWSPDGASLVFRRSGPRAAGGGSQLFSVSASGGDERLLASAPEALFPIAFSVDGALLYYAALGEQGSDLYGVELANGEETPVARLSADLTRDWALSPDGRLLAFLEMTFAGGSVAARAFLLDLGAGTLTAVGFPDSDAFNPRWDADGNLYLGQLKPGALKGEVIVIGSGLSTSIGGPRRGFDVPLAAQSQAGLAVTSFDGRSVVDPGRATLVVIGADGVRREISAQEVTFLGWITP